MSRNNTGNYQLVYHHAKNVGIIGILAYPKNMENIHRSYGKIQ